MTSILVPNKSIELFEKKIEEYEEYLTYSEGATEDEDLEWLAGHTDGMWAAVRILKEMIKSGEIT